MFVQKTMAFKEGHKAHRGSIVWGRWVWIVYIFIIAVLSPAWVAGGQDRQTSDDQTYGGYNVGYRVIQVTAPDRLGRNGPIDVAVWYPSLDPAKPFRYVYGQNEVSTLLAVNGKAAAGPFPLVIHSHGATGSGLGSAFLTERLAREGFIVAAPDHTDEYFVSRIRAPVPIQDQMGDLKVIDWILDLRDVHFAKRPLVSRKNFAYRALQARAVIDTMLAQNKNPASPFHNLIDRARIGMVGHSFGAWTTMLMAGAETRYADKRLKAVVPLSGPLFPNLYSDEEMTNIKIPIMFMYGQLEYNVGRLPNGDRSLFYDRANRPKFLLEIRGADHFTFSGGVRFEFTRLKDYTLDDPRRSAIVDYTVDFFKYYLKKEMEALKRLQQQQNFVTLYLKDFGNPAL
jgi:predicted dienelactone hydrolase